MKKTLRKPPPAPETRWDLQATYAKELGMRISDRMAEINMTASQLSKRCDCHVSRIDQMRRGKGCPTLYFAMQLAAALEVSVDWLATGEE